MLEKSENSRAISVDSKLDGLELSAYAQAHALSADEIWQRIRAGSLMGRTQGGKVYVYDCDAPLQGSPQAPSTACFDGLPPLPPTDRAVVGGAALDLSTSPQSTELALLLDHLSLAKEEHREILKLTQDSIKQITAMAESLVAVKDSLIAHKDEQLQRQEREIEKLKAQVKKKSRSGRRLSQELEDIQMLVKTLEPK